MAGAGYKLFNTGDVLTAAQVNTYLMEQTVMVFANAAARTTALSGVVAEGMMSYLKDTKNTEYYNGTSWVVLSTGGDITGVTAGTGISGGGTSGTVTITNSMATAINAKGDLIVGTGDDTFDRVAVGSNGTVLTSNSGSTTGTKFAFGGLTYITGTSFSAVNSVTLPADTFTSSFLNYKILFVIDSFPTSSGNMPVVLQLRTGTTNNSSSNYYYARGFWYPSTAGATGGLGTYFELGVATAPNGGHFVIDLLSPKDTTKTQISSFGLENQNGNLPIGSMTNGVMTVTTSYDAAVIATAAGTTMTGYYRVYGYGENYA